MRDPHSAFPMRIGSTEGAPKVPGEVCSLHCGSLSDFLQASPLGQIVGYKPDRSQ